MYQVSRGQLTAYLGVGEGPQPVVVLLAGGVEEPEGVGLPPDHHRHSIIVEHLDTHSEARVGEGE